LNLRRARFRISHAAFSVALPALIFAACNAPNIDRLARWFGGPDRLDYVALSAYLLAGLCLFIAFFTVLAHRWSIKPAAIVLAVASALAAYFIAKYDIAFDSSMMRNVAHTDATEVRQLLSSQMLPWLAVLAGLPIVAVLCTDITFRPAGRYLLASAAVFAGAVTIALVSVYLNYHPIHRAGNISRKYIVHSLVPVNFLVGGISAVYGWVRPLIDYRPADTAIAGHVESPGHLVVVLAIGESSRRRNFSLYGYRRQETNPVLRTIDGLHLLHGIADRGSTLNALPKILEKKGVKLPALVAKFGIPTACYVNYSLYDNCEPIGEIAAGPCGHGGKCYDEDVIPLLAANIVDYESGQRFIVLHLGGGSHGPLYQDRHPPEFRRLQPACNDADVVNQCTLQELHNAYDNTIVYLDHVLGRMLYTLERSGAPYVFIYLSDHGESLMEGGRLFHGMPPGIPLPPEQAEIPLIVKSSVPISIVERAVYRQQDVFDTVVDLFGIRTVAFDRAGSFIKLRSGPGTAGGTDGVD